MRRSTPTAGAIAAVLVDQLPDCRAQFRVLLNSGGARESLPGDMRSTLGIFDCFRHSTTCLSSFWLLHHIAAAWLHHW